MKRALSFVLTFAMVASLIVYSPEKTMAAASKVVKSLTVTGVTGSGVTVNTKATKNVSAKVTTLKKVAAANLKVTVTSSNKSVVTAKVKTNPTKTGTTGTSTIVLTGVKKGTAYVTVTTVSTNKSNKKVSKKFKVTVKDAAVTSVSGSTISKTSLYVGESAKITAKVLPTYAANKKVTYTSSNKTVATVTSAGYVRAVKAGKAYITVKSVNGKKKTFTVTVKNREVTSVKASISKTTLEVGETAKIAASVLPTNATIKTLTYSSSNSNVAEVSKTGVVTAKSAGIATITVKSNNGKVKTFTVTVNPVIVEVVTFVLDETQKSLKVGDTFTLNAQISPANATNKTVTWSSDNVAVATVDNSGKVTANGAGTANIKAVSSNGLIATCTVTVAADTKVTGVTLSDVAINLPVMQQHQLTATVLPEDAADKSVTWTTTNPAVATVDQNGLVKAIAGGEASIKVTTTDGKYAATCVVTVDDSSLKNASKVTINVANSLEDYANTVLTGSNADIRVQALNDAGLPVANTDIVISVKSEYTSGHSYEFGILNNSAINDTLAVTTDKDGYASVSLGLRTAGKYKSTDEVYESFKVTAEVTGSGASATQSVSFACIRMGGIRVMNNRDAGLNDLAPHTNAVEKSWNPIAHTWSIGGYRNNEYVTNQMHSSSTVDHSVTFSATPVIIIPAKNENQHYGNFTRRIDYDSTDYEVYNSSSDNSDNTTCWINDLPAGIQSASIHFDDVVLSEYTILRITVYNANSFEVLGSEVKDVSNLSIKNEFDYQLPVQENTPMSICVSLESEGQGNLDSNDGYKITTLEGVYTNQNKTEGEMHDIGTVKWEKENKKYDSVKEITIDEAKKYISDSKFVDEKNGYKYSYEVPTFPRTGNAYIYVQDKNETVVGIFSYPTENTWRNYNDTGYPTINDRTVYPTNTTFCDKSYYTLSTYPGITGFNYEGVINADYIATLTRDQYGMYANKNDIKAKSDYNDKNAVNISQDQASKSVGTIRQSGNNCVVDSTESGSTQIKAIVSVPSLNDSQLNYLNGAELHTSVQWSPLPEEEATEAIDDFYAIRTQTVKVVAQVVDKSTGQILSTPNVAVRFYSEDDEIKTNGTLVTNSLVNVQNLVTNTDKDGRAYIEFTSSDVEGFVSALHAECQGYDVQLYVGKHQEKTKKCNINWVDIGLAFTDRVAYTKENGTQYKSYTTSTLNGEHTAMSYDNDGTGTKLVNTVANRPVGTNWMFGYKVVGKLAAVSPYNVDAIDNVKVNISQQGETGMQLYKDNRPDGRPLDNGKCIVYSEKNIAAQIIGAINGNSFGEDASNVTFVFRDKVTGAYIGTFKNAGVNKPGIDDKLSINFNWETVGKFASIVLPNGINVDKNLSTTAYVKVEDKFGNPIKGATVKYSTTGVIEILETSKKTDSFGLVKIVLKAPKTTGNVTISAKVDDTVDANAATLTYKDTISTIFDVVGARIEKDSNGKNYVKIVYTSDINPESIRKDLFLLESSVDGAVYKIKDVAIDSDYQNVLNVTFEDDVAQAITSDNGVISVYTNNKTIGEINYKLTDTNGRQLPASNNAVVIAPKKEFQLEAKLTSAGNLKITVKDNKGNDISSSLDPQYGNVYAYSQVKEVLGGDGYIVKTDVGLNITVNKQSTSETVYVYYCGYRTTVTIPAK